MLMFHNAVRKLTNWVILQDHTLLQVTSLMKLLYSFCQILEFHFLENAHSGQTKLFLSTCYGDSSTEVPLRAMQQPKLSAAKCTIVPVQRNI